MQPRIAAISHTLKDKANMHPKSARFPITLLTIAAALTACTYDASERTNPSLAGTTTTLTLDEPPPKEPLVGRVPTLAPATPSFTMKGTPPTPSGSPLHLCESNVTMNASATSYASKYFISIQESDQWWNPTGDYAWGRWFSGQAPSSLNLQQLSTTYSYPPDFTGSPARQGSPLIGGNLPVKGARYYRVNLCTEEPSRTCQSALIQVDGNC